MERLELKVRMNDLKKSILECFNEDDIYKNNKFRFNVSHLEYLADKDIFCYLVRGLIVLEKDGE